MKALITGAGQIGRQLLVELQARGAETVVLRRSSHSLGNTVMMHGDAADRQLLRQAASDVDVIFHCIHTTYDADAWRRELPHREQAVMDVASELSVPVVFPESVYAFGRRAVDLTEGETLEPCTPLGDVRAELLTARRNHPARTLSIVASDLVGSTASKTGSIPTTTVIEPARTGRRCWPLGDPTAPHSVTTLPDLSRAMIMAATTAHELAPDGDAVLNAPSPNPLSMKELASLVAERHARPTPVVHAVPTRALSVLGLASRPVRALAQQSYLWDNPTVLRPGLLTTKHGVDVPAWSDVELEPLTPSVSVTANG